MRDISVEVITKAIDNAPEPVREVLRSIETAQTIGAIGKKYQLHIDVIGKLSELNRNLLVGLISPTEVLGELVVQGLEASQAKGILTDLNEKIFLPLSTRIKASVPAASVQSAATTQPVSQPQISAPHIQMPPGQLPAAPIAIPVIPVMNQSAHPQHPIGDSPSQVPPSASWHPAATVHVYVPSQAAHEQTPAHVETPAAPRVQTVTASSKPAMVPSALPVASSIPEKSYAADPYREPF